MEGWRDEERLSGGRDGGLKQEGRGRERMDNPLLGHVVEREDGGQATLL